MRSRGAAVAAMAVRAGGRTETDAPVDEGDAAFWTRAASYGFVRPEEIDPDQAWVWTRKRIAGEIEASEDVSAGRVTRYMSNEDFLTALRERAARDADV